MRNRKKTFVKIVSAKPNEAPERHIIEVSTEAKIRQLVNELGIDPSEYKFKANLRKFTRAYMLGINL